VRLFAARKVGSLEDPKGACRVQVTGYRQGLCRALTDMGIPWALWSEKEPKASLQFEMV